jgi:hypothetical protein
MTNLIVAYAVPMRISENLSYPGSHTRHDFARIKLRWQVPSLGHCHTALQCPLSLHLKFSGTTK